MHCFGTPDNMIATYQNEEKQRLKIYRKFMKSINCDTDHEIFVTVSGKIKKNHSL